MKQVENTDELKRNESLRKFRYTYFHNPSAVTATIIFLILLILVIFAPLFTKYDPINDASFKRLLSFGASGHILGTDEQGRDLLSRCLYGGRLSLFMGFTPVVLASVMGAFLGIISGYFGKMYATVIMRTLDVFYAFPSIMLAIALSTVLNKGIPSIIIPITIVLIPPIARVSESVVREIMSEDYMEAAQTSGAGNTRIIVRFVLPNAFGRIFIYCTTQFSVSLLSASALSFLGLGISPPTPEWGTMLNSLRQQIFIEPLITIIPGLFIFITALTVNMMADGFKSAFNSIDSL